MLKPPEALDPREINRQPKPYSFQFLDVRQLFLLDSDQNLALDALAWGNLKIPHSCQDKSGAAMVP